MRWPRQWTDPQSGVGGPGWQPHTCAGYDTGSDGGCYPASVQYLGVCVDHAGELTSALVPYMWRILKLLWHWTCAALCNMPGDPVSSQVHTHPCSAPDTPNACSQHPLVPIFTKQLPLKAGKESLTAFKLSCAPAHTCTCWAHERACQCACLSFLDTSKGVQEDQAATHTHTHIAN